jgi:hypothetical protein
MPPADCIDILAGDYAHMANMIFGEVPSIESIFTSTQRMESEINKLD